MGEEMKVDRAFYNKLLRDSEFLRCLRECGVDNWEGYAEACCMMVPKSNGEFKPLEDV